MAFLKNHMTEDEEKEYLKHILEGKKFKEYIGVIIIRAPRALRYKILAEDKEDAEKLLESIVDEILPIQGCFLNARVEAEYYVEEGE